MNFPRFWAKGEQDGFVSWRWSDLNLDEARTLAQQAARKLADRIRAGDVPRNRYGYADRPMREPVLREFKTSTGELAAAVTRNSYGCLVLNTARVMFVDVDLPEPKSSGGFLKKLFGGPKPPPPDDAQSSAIAKAEAWAHAHPGWGWRVYRTRSGLRLLATHDVFDPENVVNLFDALGADPLYRQLCKIQKCFRARLTPKPWRCDVENPPGRWPFADEKAEGRFKQWQTEYDRASGAWATCELIRTIGNRETHPEVQLVLALHDGATRAESKLQLA